MEESGENGISERGKIGKQQHTDTNETHILLWSKHPSHPSIHHTKPNHNDNKTHKYSKDIDYNIALTSESVTNEIVNSEGCMLFDQSSRALTDVIRHYIVVYAIIILDIM